MEEAINSESFFMMQVALTLINAGVSLIALIACGIFTALNAKLYTEYFKDISRTKAFEKGKDN